MIRLIKHFLRGKVCWRKIFCSNNSTWKGKLENFKKNVNSSFFLNGKAGKRRSYSRDSNLIAWLKSGTRICHLPAVDRGQVCQKYFKKTVIKPWWNKKKWSSWETDHYNFDLWLRDFSTGMLAKSWEVVSFDLEALSPDLAKLLKLSRWKAGEQIAPLPSHFRPRSPRLCIAGISRRRYIHLQPSAANQR